MKKVQRRSVDLSAYHDLVVIYLGMRVNTWTGLKTLVGMGPKIGKAIGDQPEGLLRHENVIYSLFPPHVGMRQYWRDFASLERWARSDPHRQWWQQFLKNSGGTGFWHESYFMQGGMEAVYDDVPTDIGFLAFAPQREARGKMYSARDRAQQGANSNTQNPVSEEDYYRDDSAPH